MSGPIKKGDLVMVVRPALCGCPGQLGAVYTVLLVERAHGPGRCTQCRAPTFHEGATVAHLSGQAVNARTEVRRLKKIDPPSAGEYDRVPVRKAQPRKVPA